MATPIQTKLITAAARTVLRPIGVSQVGRSRTWIADHGWWLCVVEFQPSNWSRGTYLNVGCNWLWSVKNYLSFDEGYRVEDFCEFENEEDFKVSAEHLARRAAQEIERYRRLFPSATALSEFCSSRNPLDGWPAFHAGIACALVGRLVEARLFFDRLVESNDDDRDWVVALQNDAVYLRALCADGEQFRHEIIERVRQSRELLKLPAQRLISFVTAG